jgi:hypothetical protein
VWRQWKLWSRLAVLLLILMLATTMANEGESLAPQRSKLLRILLLDLISSAKGHAEDLAPESPFACLGVLRQPAEEEFTKCLRDAAAERYSHAVVETNNHPFRPISAMTRTWETLAAFIRFERMPALGHRDAHLPCGVTLQSEGNYPSFLTGNYPSSFLSLKAVPNRDCAQLH